MKYWLIENYTNALQELYDHVGFVEDWVLCPIDDCTLAYWNTDGNIVRYADTLEDFTNENGDYMQDDVYKQRFYKKWIYEGKIFTMIFCDPHVDATQWFRVFRNDLKTAMPKDDFDFNHEISMALINNK